jgi:uncharacterized protein
VWDTALVDRRVFIGRMALLAGAAAVGPRLLRQSSADAAVVSGPGPYGALLAADARGIQLPAGFSSRVIGTSGQAVVGTGYSWHQAPDGGACFPAPGGGWVYVSNSEVSQSSGGASAVRFQPDGTIDSAYRILTGTNVNCAGGPTPWGTWLSCEENGVNGRVFECDPQQPGQGVRRDAMGSFAHEAAAVDPATGHVYLTEDNPAGRLYRFTPTTPGDLSSGSLFAARVSGTSVSWVAVSASAPDRSLTTTVFNGGEGAWIAAGTLWFTTKGDGRVWELDLSSQQLTVLYDDSTTSGAPLTGVDNITRHAPSGDLYVAEDGGNLEICLITTADASDVVAPFLRLVGHTSSEITGPAFSPDGSRLYFSSQRGTNGTGVTFEVTGPFRTAGTPPTSVTVPISVDSYVRDGTYADINYGSATTLQICRTASVSSNRIAYLQLDTTSVVDDIASVTLRLWTRGTTTTATTVNLHGVGVPWSEGAVTWATRPALGAVVGSYGLSNATYGWKEIDVTSYVNAERAAGRPVVSFGVQHAAADHQLGYIGAGEGTSNRPEAVIQAVGTPSSTTTTEATTTTTGPTTTTTMATTTTTMATTTTTTGSNPATIPIEIDTYARDGASQNSNFGTNTLLDSRRSTTVGETRVAYVRLDTAGVTGTIQSARVRFACRNAASATTLVELLAVPTTTWSETALRWTNRPAVGAVLGSFSVTSTAHAWKEVDVTAYVNAERAAGRTAVSFALQPATNGELVYINSGEATSMRPELRING